MFISSALFLFYLFPQLAQAFPSEHFRGWYKLDGSNESFMAYDVDRLEVLWRIWVREPLPEDLKEYRNEPTVIVYFNFRNSVFLTFERNIVYSQNFLAVPGSNNTRFEMVRRGDGKMDGLVVDGAVEKYVFTGPNSRPTALARNSSEISLYLTGK